MLAAVLALLEVLCRTGAISPVKLLPPSTMIAGIGEILASGQVLGQIARTLTDLAAAVVLALVAGRLLGGGFDAMRRATAAVEPVLYAVPIFVLYPLLVVVFGSSHYTRIAIASLSALTAMVVSTVGDVEHVVPASPGSPRTAGLGKGAPGLGLVVASAFAGLFVAELIRSADGVGHAIAFAFDNFENRRMYALVLVVLVGVTAVSGALDARGRRVLRQTGQMGAPLEITPTRGFLVGGFMLVAALIALWQLLALVAGSLVPISPWRIVVTAATLLPSADVAPRLAETGSALLKGYAIAVAVGLPVGLWLGASELAGAVAAPMLAALDRSPKMALYPVLLVAFGIGVPARVALGAIHGVVPVALWTASPVPRHRYYAPAAWALRIFTGLRVGLVLTLTGTLAGEVFASQRGIGYRLVQAMDADDTQTVLALTLIVVTLTSAAGAVLLGIDRRLHRRAVGMPAEEGYQPRG